jgi:outer membrane receptor protein involved in Fe transport
MTNHSKTRGVRKNIFNSTAIAGVVAAALFTPTTAMAQDAAAAEDEVIVVTGSRIQRPDFQFSNPVVSSTAEEIANSGTTNLLDYLQTVPALNNSLNGVEAFPNAGFAGVDLLNLRNLGTNRTLVLVDGRRHVPGNPGTGAVDVSTIPTDLVERVDVLTGGASALYGADAVSGVVNFVMQDDFEGLRVRGEAGAPSDDGQDTQFLAVTLGTNFADGRGNIAGSFEYSNETRLVCEQRTQCIDEVRFVTNPNNAIYGPYSRIPLSNLVWFSSGRGGAVATDAFGSGDFYTADYDGATDAPWDFGTDFDPPNGVYDIGFTYGQGGSGTPTRGYTETLLPSVERFNINLLTHFDITNSMRLYGQMKMVHSEAFNATQPGFDYAYEISTNNPFMPTNIRNNILLNGETGGYISRDHFELGIGGENQERDTVRGVVGVSGDVTEHLRYDISFTAGQLSEDYTSTNARFEDRFAAAIDVVDPDGAGPLGPTCRVNVDPAGYLLSYNLNDREATSGQPNYPSPISFTAGPGSGCLPLNTFGEGNADPAAIDWVMNDLHTESRVRQQVFTAAFNGDFGSFLQLQGGPIGWAGGVEWRRESLTATPDNFSQLGVTQAGPVAITQGSYEVAEGFVEASLPIFRDVPFAENLTLDWAHRYSEYSSSGAANTWKFGLTYAPIEQLTFRATRAEAVRAPNIGELYAPLGTTFQFILDPCTATEVGNGPDPAQRAANCAVLLAAASAPAPGLYVDPFAAFTKTGQAGGNANLGVETAQTDTFGVIWRPSFLERFAISVDYYDIVIEDAINLVDPQDIADKCVDAPTTVGNPFCLALQRQVGGGGAGGITYFLQAPFNVAEFTTRGIDLTIAYRFDPADWGLGEFGTFDIRAVVNNTQELGFVPLPGIDKDDDLSESLSVAPDWQMNLDVTWEIGRWTTHYGYNFTTDMLRYENNQYAADPLRVAPEYKYADGLRAHSIQVRYNLNDVFEIYGGANNLGYDYNAGDPNFGDPNGQFFYMGAVANF